MALERITYADRPDLAERLEGEESGAFPEFLLHDSIWNECWPYLISEFAHLQSVIYDPDRDEVVGAANAVPLRWDGTTKNLPAGTHDAMQRSIAEHSGGVTANTICGVQAIATKHARGQGLSDAFVRFSKIRTKDGGFDHSITPLRPLLKDRYPTIDLADYAGWTGRDGLPFDPWLRVWLRAGARQLAICNDSLVIEASVEEWEAWTELELPATGGYVIPGGQELLQVDVASDRGRYSEGHVWIEIP